MKMLFKIIFLFITVFSINAQQYDDENAGSKANQELREKEIKAVQNIVNFFNKDFVDRETRFLIGYNYFPDYPFGFEGGLLRNGLGGFFSFATNFSLFTYSFSYIGESVGMMNISAGITYPLYFNWLWFSAGIEGYINEVAYDSYTFSYDNSTSIYTQESFGFGLSAGIYISKKRIFLTAKYRYLVTDNQNSFMLGIGLSFSYREMFIPNEIEWDD